MINSKVAALQFVKKDSWSEKIIPQFQGLVMLPYSLEDSLQIGLHSFYCGMSGLGKFFNSSLLASNAEIFPENQVLVRCQDVIKQGVNLLADFKTGRTMEGMVVVTIIHDAVLRSEVLPLVLNLHIGILFVKKFLVCVHLLLLDYLVLFLKTKRCHTHLEIDLSGLQYVDADSAAKPLKDFEQGGDLNVGMTVLHTGDIGLLRTNP